MSSLSGKFIPRYDSAPMGQIQTEELTELMNLRDALLHEIEKKIQGKEKNERSSAIKFLLTSYQTNDNKKKTGDFFLFEDKDKTSHFVLSLAYCKTDQERNWFASLESKLFIGRIEAFRNEDWEEVLPMLNIPLERQDNIPDNLLEKIRFREKSNSPPGIIYRIPFEYALNLIPTMQYFLHKGFVYITKAEIGQLVETVFKENLITKLLNINRHLDKILSDSRIRSIVSNFQTRREVETLSKSFNNVQSNNISFKEIDPLAEKAFPLCMQLLNKALNSDNHLKHWGRLQYGLFLKGIGLSLEEALNFWRSKFSKIASDKFEKEYAYGFRHQYGKEGKRNDYIPYSCNKIQISVPHPGSGEYHGCPFNVFNDEKMKNLLYSMNFKELEVLKILEKVRNKEPSIACIRYFEARYPNLPYEQVGIHPNHFFESSFKMFKSDDKSKDGHFNNKYGRKKIAFENPIKENNI